MNIPIVAVVDTNGNPENIEYPIPGNDDAVRAIELFASKISQAIVEGKKKRVEKELQEEKKEEAPAVEEALSPSKAPFPDQESSEKGPSDKS
jgi:small subunit ribosomal protein S2